MTKPKPDLSEFKPRKGGVAGQCAVGRILTQLTDQDRVNVQAALTARDELTGQLVYTHESIVDYLGRRGHSVSEYTVRRHRKEGHVCEQPAA